MVSIYIYIYIQVFQIYTNGFKGQSLFEDPSDPNSGIAKAFVARDELNGILSEKFIETEQLIKNNKWNDKYGIEQKCVLSSLIENDAVFDNDGKYGLYDKVDAIIGYIFASYDSSATSLNNLVYAMYKHPKETNIVKNSIINNPILSNKNTIFSIDLLKNNCNELECFIDESLRMYGFAPMYTRNVYDENGLNFGGYLLPKGTTFGIPVKWLHFGEGSWTESIKFKPTRFDKSNNKTKEERGDIGKYNNIPFATGLHKCLGMHLALLQMKIFTVLLLRDYQFKLDENKLKDENEAINEINLSQSLAHFNVYLKINRKTN